MTSPTDLRLGGFVTLSTVDWPGQLAATVFTRGCPWDCPYCHNPHLRSVSDPSAENPSWRDMLGFLEQRRGLLDGVVFTGGEPTAQPALPDAMAEARAMGFGIGLHTNGAYPERLETALRGADWVGFDVKAPFAAYERITRMPGSGERALTSLRLLIATGGDFEVRTTVHPALLSRNDLSVMADELEAEGVRRWVVQAYRADGVRTGELPPAALTATDLPEGLADRFDFALR